MRPSLRGDPAGARLLAARTGSARRGLSLRRLAPSGATGPLVRVGAEVLGVCGLLTLLCWRLFTDAPHLMADFQTDSWLIAHQADTLRQGHVPSHFLHSGLTVFYPVFAFYGGTLFVFAAAIALVTGSSAAAEVIVYVLALAAAYGGWLWLGRMAGLRWWQAHVPAILYITSPYVVTDVYVRQDLTETVATAMIPLLFASSLSILRADRLRAGPAAALAASTVTLGGSHNLTLLWGATIMGIVVWAFVAAVPSARGLVSRRGLLRVLAVVVPAMAVNAWYLVPDLVYHTHTTVAHRIDEWRALVSNPGPAVDAKYLFALGRPSAYPGSDLSLTLPVLAMAWVLIAAVSARQQWRQPWARTLAILALTSTVVLVLITHPKLLLVLPDPWLMVQFSYRLESFVLFCICGAVIAALVLTNRGGHRWLAVLLIPITGLGIVGAVRQIHAAPRSAVAVIWPFDELTTFGFGDFGDSQVRRLSPPNGMAPMIFTRQGVDHDRIDTTVAARPGDVLFTDVMVPAAMIDIQGAHVVGRWLWRPWKAGWQRCSYLVLQVDGDAVPGQAHITMREARTLPITGGRILSILGLLGLAANAVVILRARRQRLAESAWKESRSVGSGSSS
jgi:hypothetical protein